MMLSPVTYLSSSSRRPSVRAAQLLFRHPNFDAAFGSDARGALGLQLLQPAVLLDKHAVGMLTVLAADVGLDEVASVELGAVRPVAKMLGVVRRRDIIDVLAVPV